MKVELEIPNYNPEENAVITEWDEDAIIQTDVQSNGAFRILANRDGLITLARHLITLAQDDIPKGYHLHYDKRGGLEDASVEFILERF